VASRSAPRSVEPLDAPGARRAALDALARRDHGSGELARKLLASGYDARIVTALIEGLAAERLLNDRRYVENFIAYHAARGEGPVRVRAALHKRGVEGEVVEELLAAHPDWIVQLRKVREKKFGASLPTGYADRQRQMRFLGYRGFTGAQIRTALGFDIDLDDEREEPF
jgi:regulatory protein